MNPDFEIIGTKTPEKVNPARNIKKSFLAKGNPQWKWRKTLQVRNSSIHLKEGTPKSTWKVFKTWNHTKEWPYISIKDIAKLIL